MQTDSFITLDNENQNQIKQILAQSKQYKQAACETDINSIIDILDRVGRLWGPKGHYYQLASQQLSQEINFSLSMIQVSLNLIPEILNAKNLYQRLNSEFQNPIVLNRFIASPNFNYQLRAFPVGILLHVTAGNVFLGMLDSLVMGLITKNINYIKLSHKNQSFPKLLWQSILEADKEHLITEMVKFFNWKGGNTLIEQALKNSVDGIIVWGGEASQQAYAKDLDPSVKFFGHGPKISFELLTKKSFELLDEQQLNKLGEKIAHDLCLWDQSACASPQNLFIPKDIDQTFQVKLMQAIARGLENFSMQRGELAAEDQIELIKCIANAELESALNKGSFLKGDDWFIQLDTSPYLSPSPLGRSLLIKCYENIESFSLELAPFAYYLQTCGLYCHPSETEEITKLLSLSGVKRICATGNMLEGVWGAPHDGRFGLTELVQFVSLESKLSNSEKKLETILDHSRANIPYFQNIEISGASKIASFPYLSGKDLQAYPLSHSYKFLDKNLYLKGGAIFASGGTSGKPKYSFYTHDEFIHAAKLLAIGFKACGVKPGMKIANLFVAGNFWSSFRAVGEAIRQVGAIELPIGSLASKDDILTFLNEFKPDIVMGIPGLLMEYVNHCLENHLKLDIPIVFFAGEGFSESAKLTLKDVWKTKHIHSAGYASVDAGPIGYADSKCLPGEHYVFDDIHMEIIDDEAVVTSLYRYAMPIIRYKTGDRIEVIATKDEKIHKFKLLGRLDGQIQLWSCKFYYSDIEKALAQFFLFDDGQTKFLHN